jgi:hypothetical protein
MHIARTNQPIELPLTAKRAYTDLFNEVEVDVVFRDAAGESWRVPAFWAGDTTFRVRFAAPRPGRYTWRSECTNPADAGLHGQAGELTAAVYDGPCALYRHGRLRVAESRRTFEHADGTPFLWLADTWWMGLTKRLDWPEGFQGLVADRVDKGFNTVQIVAGPLPDFCATKATWDPQQANEAGWPWEPEFARINPAFYDLADQRLVFMIEQGLMPCIVSMWGYYLPFMGVERCKRHWRYLVARYGAYPVTWGLCGECTMPTYAHHGPERDEKAELQMTGWTEVARDLRGMDPYRNLLAVHPSCNVLGRMSLTDEALSDFDMLQTGHGGYYSLINSVAAMEAATRREPRMPVLNSEVNYEGIMGGNKDEIQRFLFWASLLQGACGHTYGAQGMWAMNSRHEPFKGTTGSWGEGFWQEVMHYPGAAQVGLGAQILRNLPWWRLEPDYTSGTRFVARVPGEVIVAYVPCRCFPPELVGSPFPLRIEDGVRYRAQYISPRTGEAIPAGEAVAEKGQWVPPRVPGMDDWVLILERE